MKKIVNHTGFAVLLKYWFYHEFSGLGFKRPEDQSHKMEESANLKFIPTNENRFE